MFFEISVVLVVTADDFSGFNGLVCFYKVYFIITFDRDFIFVFA